VNEVLKQRLIGALILLALAVIFWPIIFVEPGSEEVDRRGEMPPPPGLAATPVGPPDPVGLRQSPPIMLEEPAVAVPEPEPEPDRAQVPPPPEPAQEAEPAAVSPGVPVRDEAPEQLRLDENGVPLAWVLQVASVSSGDKAEDLRGRLLALGHKAYVEQASVNGRALYRVYVGPKFERAALERLQKNIDAEFGVSSMVRRYVP
jgi:DedD protein